MNDSWFNRRAAASAAAAFSLLLTGGALPAVAEPAASTAVRAKTRLTAEQRAKIRKALRVQVRRDPASVFRKPFLKKADLVDFKLPLTVRLHAGPGISTPPDDALQIEWDNTADPWPSGSSPAAVQTVPVTTGIFTMEADFGGDSSGYELGAIETLEGGNTQLHTPPFDIAAPDPACDPSANPPAQIVADHSPSGTDVVLSSAGWRYGVVNFFSQEIRGSLSLATTLNATVSTSCQPLTATAGTPAASSPISVRYTGAFHLSPAITSDGKMRLGKIVIDDAVTPQTSTATTIRACTSTLACNEQAFPARVKILKLTADVLLGDIRST